MRKKRRCVILKGWIPFPPEFARNFVAGFIGAILSPIEVSKLKATVGSFVFQSGFLAPKYVSPIIMVMLLLIQFGGMII